MASIDEGSLMKDAIRRTRELYRYVTPASLSPLPAAHYRETIKLDTVFDASDMTPSLIAFVQLAALRCNTSKAILNVMDTDTMYFLAQVSKRPSDGQEDAPMFESSEDSALMGCSTMSLSGRVCDLTLRLHTDENCPYPCLTISDMSKDVRFAHLDIVAGGPKFRFYCGTPITTRDGINIGTLAVMDSTPRDRLTRDEEQCLCETAAYVMKVLNLNREAIEGRQARRMGYALNSFVAGKSSLDDDEVHVSRKLPSKRSLHTIDETVSVSHLPTQSQPSQCCETRNKRTTAQKGQCTQEQRDSAEKELPFTTENSADASPVTDSDHEATERYPNAQSVPIQEIEEMDSRTHCRTFVRAANLLREALDLGDKGGVLFVSVSAESNIPGFLSGVQPSVADESSTTGDDSLPENVALDELAQLVRSPTFLKHSSLISATTLASSTNTAPMREGDALSEEGSIKLDSQVVNYFVGRYPAGRLLLLEENDWRSSSDETAQDVKSHGRTKSSRVRRKLAELEFLRRALPEARHLLMVPLWDPSEGRISSACFVWSSSQSRLFSKRQELSYLTSFCQTLMAECSRIDAMAADRQKGSFVGIVSRLVSCSLKPCPHLRWILGTAWVAGQS